MSKTKCSECGVKYKTYPVLLCDDLECFVIEMEIKELYYNEKENVGLCKKCRDKLIKNDWEMHSIFMIVWAKLCASDNRKDKKVKDAIERVRKRMDKMEQKFPRCKWCNVFYKPNKEGNWRPQCDNNEKLCKLHKKEFDEEMNDNRTEKEMRDKMCVYCDEFKGQKFIPNPNMVGKRWWVCVTCEKIIKEQHKLSFGAMVAEKGIVKDFGKKMMKEAQEKIDKLSYESGVETSSIMIERQNNGKYKAKRLKLPKCDGDEK